MYSQLQLKIIRSGGGKGREGKGRVSDLRIYFFAER